MKTPTPPAVSEELDIPKPAPGENVYPIYSQGVICGYIHSGGNQKTHKIFLNGENQTSSTENKDSKLKTNDSKKKSCSAKLPPKIAVKRTSTQSVSSKHKKAKTVLSTEKIPVLPNVPRIESNILKNPSDKLNIPYTPTNRPNGDVANLGNKGHTPTDNVPMQVPVQTSSELASSKTKQTVQQIKPSTDTNTKSSVVMTSSSLCSLSSSNITNLAKKIVTSSNVTPSTKDTVVLSPPVMNNFNQPILLASNNLALQPTNWMTPPIQSSWPNPVAYVIMPASHDLSQTPVYLANSTNNLPPVLPKTTNVSLTTTTTTTTTVPPGPVIQPSSITTSTATAAPITMPSKVTTTTNSCSQLLTMLPLKGVVPKSTFVQLPLQLSASSSISKRQPTYLPFKHLKILEQTNSETENNAFKAASVVNVSSKNLAIQQSSKQEADNSVSAFSSLHYLLSNDDNTKKDSLSIGHSARSNESDVSSPELNKIVEEKTIDSNLSPNSNQKDKSETSADATVSISDENKNPPCQSLPENVKFTLVPIKKRRGRPRKPLVSPPKYERKQIPILPATANTDGKPSADKPHAFNLLPSGNYMICFQKEGAQSDELNVDNSQHEPNQEVICEKVKKGRGRKSKSKLSLSEEEYEMPHLPKQNEISMKTEPFDEDSELDQEECENLSNNCASSVSPSVADIQMNFPIKQEKGLETESTIQEENELVISNCFSLSSPTESNKKLIPFSMANSGLDNLFFFPNQTDLGHKSLEASSIVQDENSTKVAEEVKVKKCSVKLEQLNFPSESLVEPSLSSSSEEEEENNLPYSSSSSEENNLPCTKPAEDTHTFCNSTLKEDESNVAMVGSSTDTSTDTMISVKTPAKSILDLEYLKKLKNNCLSVEKDEFPVVPSDSNEASLGSKSKSSSLSKDILLTSGSINDSLKPFNKSFGDLHFTADSFVANLPKGDEADTFIEGCIAFHQQQLYLLQLQMDQHKSILEKLKKAQTCLKGTK